MNAITTVVQFKVKSRFEEEMRADGLAYAEYTKGHTPGCLEFHATVDPDNPEWMIFIEVWESKEASDYHLSTDSFYKMATMMADRCKEIHIFQTLEIQQGREKTLTDWM